jgi:hypothetical protein
VAAASSPDQPFSSSNAARNSSATVVPFRRRRTPRCSALFGRIDWIDTDHNGDILLAREGKLERLRRGDIKAGNPKVVADLHDMAFEPLEAPNWAQTWPKRRPSKR